MEGKTLLALVTLVGGAAIALGTSGLHAIAPTFPPPPARPQPPPPPEALMNSELKYAPGVYRALLEQDAKGFGVPAPSLEELGAPNAYFEEVTARRKLRPAYPIDTAHLRLSLEVAKRRAVIEGQAFATEHLVLRIENRTQRYLAYRVETDLPDRRRCGAKGEIPHNALVLEPGQILERTECLYRGSAAVDVLRAEVMELLPLGAHYVSRLPATPALYEPRVTGGHMALKGALCPQTFSWREIKEGIERKAIGWRDVVDFYARHSCDEYSFFKGYRYRTDPSLPLPARPRE